ncbi:hypothetical protein [Hazenella coriacea]|uniref:Immunity protein 30 of polymorphic toxin system n=1 Tax=Hazenella coriacea TaxID=1179467 RepID=A0A4R3LC80_9BACL|nr:hypothetical protein [Hazenella coriacea]TCS96870.1 hypothetical protein EDD58_101515 [Hazenella coriacea]
MKLNKIKEVLMGTDHEVKVEILSHLSDVFESYNESIEDFEEIVMFLLEYGLNETEIEMKEEIFNTLLDAATNQDIGKINFDVLEKSLDDLPIECLHSAITILSFTYNREYLPTLLKYTEHGNKQIRSDALYAVNEIETYWKLK